MSQKSDNICYYANSGIEFYKAVAADGFDAVFTRVIKHKKERYKLYWQSAIFILIIMLYASCCPASQDISHVGRRFPSERMTYTDSVTGYKITMLTTSPAKDNKIYRFEMCISLL